MVVVFVVRLCLLHALCTDTEAVAAFRGVWWWVVCGGQVCKGAWWMPWHQEPMKDVGACVKPRGVGNRTLIRGCPNGGTRPSSWAVTRT